MVLRNEIYAIYALSIIMELHYRAVDRYFWNYFNPLFVLKKKADK